MAKNSDLNNGKIKIMATQLNIIQISRSDFRWVIGFTLFGFLVASIYCLTMPKIYKAKTQIQLSIYPNFDESHATIIPSLVSQFKNSSNLSGKINDDCGLGMSKIYSANNHITIKAIPSISRTLAVEVTTTPPSTADQCINSIIEYISTENQAAFKNGMNRLKK